MTSNPTPNPKPDSARRNSHRRVKRAILQLPEVQEILNAFYDGRLMIVIEKVKGQPRTIELEIREDDLVEEVLATA